MTQKQPRMTVVAVALAACVAHVSGAAEDAAETELIRVRPATLALTIDQLAGREVQIAGARVVGMFGPRALVLDTSLRWRGTPGFRDRILVLVERGEVTVSPALLVGSPVTVSGVARTLLGVQVTREVPWPPELDRDRLERLDIRAAIVARSVRTLEGDELTSGRESASSSR